MVANASEEVYFATNESVENATQLSPHRPHTIVSIAVNWIISVTGVCANAMVLVVLVFARRHYGSHVNTLIANQSAMDLVTCIFLLIRVGVAMIPGAPEYEFGLGEVGNNVVCYLFNSTGTVVSFKNAGIFGLVMIYL